jgi:adenine-specific DNA-methyltransferase
MYSRKSNWQYIYKIFKRDYLIKDGYKQITKTHILNGRFYRELLYLMGLKEEKVDKKNVIIIDSSEKGSLANQVYSILVEEKDRPEDLAMEETFEIILVWINRLLFIKLFEGQLIAFNGDFSEYRILDNDKIRNFQEIQYLFFDVLGKREREDNTFLQQFENIPYLNSSLFERYDVEI